MSHEASKRQLSQLSQLSHLEPILDTKRRRVQGPNNHASESRVAPIQELISSSAHNQQEATTTSSSYQDQQQEAAGAATGAIEIAPATDAKVATISLDDVIENMPEPCGQPHVFAYKRGQLADALQFNKNHEGCLYTVDNVAKGMVLDAVTSPHTMIDNSIIITTM